MLALLWSPAWGQVHLEQELLAVPTAGQWEELAYSGQVPSFCKEAYGLGLGGWGVEPGSSNPQTAGRCPAAHIGEAVGQELLPPDSSSCPLDAAGTSCTCLFTTSSHNSFWEIFTIYSDCWLFIADWKVLGLGVREGLEGRKELGLSILSPDSGALPVLQLILAGSTLSSVLELSLRETPRPLPGQDRTATDGVPPARPPSQSLSAPVQLQLNFTARGSGPADTAQLPNIHPSRLSPCLPGEPGALLLESLHLICLGGRPESSVLSSTLG